MTRIYNNRFRTILYNKIKQIDDNTIINDIYYILRDDESFKPIINSNGLFFDLDCVSDDTIRAIIDIVDAYFEDNK